MLYNLLYPLAGQYSFLNVFKYITFRAFGAGITALLICMLFGPAFIRWLQRQQIGQEVRDDGPKSHFSKKGTPTMGGLLILASFTVSTLLWADLTNHYVWIALITTILYGFIGFLDDSRKVLRKNTKGLSARQKLAFQFLFAGAACYILFVTRESPPVVKFPFFKDLALDLGWAGGIPWVVFATLVVVFIGNAVNLTDGLDGLAVGPTMTTGVTFAILAYCAGNIKIAEYLQIPYIPGSGELAIFLGAVAAGSLGFLWFNTYPAQVFMGDTGSLSLGAALGISSVITKNEILLGICGGIFVLEAVSVMTQVASFKLTGKRIFKMAPIHHHFELKGWPEPKVIVRFWIISILLALVTLATLKLR